MLKEGKECILITMHHDIECLGHSSGLLNGFYRIAVESETTVDTHTHNYLATKSVSREQTLHG